MVVRSAGRLPLASDDAGPSLVKKWRECPERNGGVRDGRRFVAITITARMRHSRLSMPTDRSQGDRAQGRSRGSLGNLEDYSSLMEVRASVSRDYC